MAPNRWLTCSLTYCQLGRVRESRLRDIYLDIPMQLPFLGGDMLAMKALTESNLARPPYDL